MNKLYKIDARKQCSRSTNSKNVAFRVGRRFVSLSREEWGREARVREFLSHFLRINFVTFLFDFSSMWTLVIENGEFES